MTNTPGTGHNNPPSAINDAIDAITSAYADTIDEAQNWLDGELVDNEDQLKAVEVLTKDIKSAIKDLEEARKKETAPLHKAWQDGNAKFKPTAEDFERIKKALIAAVAPFKKKLADEKEAKKRAAYEAQRAAENEAVKLAAAAEANASDLEVQREADEAKKRAQHVKKQASAANTETVKGMRTVHHFEIQDMRALINWIAKNDKPSFAAFATQYAKDNHRSKDLDGVRSWETKEAF